MAKENSKTLTKQYIRVLAFLLVFALLISGLSASVFSGKVISQFNRKRADSYAYLSDPENTTDIVCLGSSDMWSGFVPLTLWENYGFTSVVSSFSHQSVAQAQDMLQSITKVQSPKLVILEIDTLYDGRGPKEVIAPGSKTKLDDFFDTMDPTAFESKVTSKFSLFTFHNIWKDFQKRSDRSKCSHGYLYNDTVQKLKPRKYMVETEERDIPVVANSNELRRFVKYCNDNDLQLMFLEMPTFSSWTYARHNAVQDLADELGVDFLDLNFKYDEMGLSIKNCFRDNGNHLNYTAACKATNYIGSYISGNYGIESRRNQPEVAEYWDNDVARFNKIKDKKNAC